MRLAAIDIGTNSVHMIVVRVRPDLSFEVIDREKEMVRLGAGGLGGRALTREAVQSALQVLAKFRRLAESHGVDETVAVATSAVREAGNGGEFLRAIRNQTGVNARVISGTEEARLIHMAAAYGTSLAGEVAVAVDIGGGSVEITRGAGATIDQGRSFKLGVIRLTEQFVKSDPLSPHHERKMVRHIQTELGEYLAQVVNNGFDRVIGTSGTALSLGAIVAAAEDGSPGAPLRNRRISARQLHRVRKNLVALDLAKRLRVPGLEPRRADLAVAGAVLLDTILRSLAAADLTLCDLSLREGLVLDYIGQHRKQIAQVDRYPDIRRRSVMELAERCSYSADHAQHVARLAVSLFDQTQGAHGLTGREREWLEYAAILHDIGVHISYQSHHKHSHYLIKNGDLRGFEPDEVELMALLARYHRRATPKRSHSEFGALDSQHRHLVKVLGALLRLAENLDRSHAQLITGVELRDGGREAVLRLKAAGDVELELWAAARQVGPLERILGKPIRFDVDGHVQTKRAGPSAGRRGARRPQARRAVSSAPPPGRTRSGRSGPRQGQVRTH